MPKMTRGSSQSAPWITAGREHHLREDHQDDARHRRGDEGGENAVVDDAGVRLVGMGKLLGEPALQPHRRQLRGQLDDDDRISEAAEQLRAVIAAGDEQEREPRREAKQEAEEIGAAALRQRGDVVAGRWRRFVHPALPGKCGKVIVRACATVRHGLRHRYRAFELAPRPRQPPRSGADSPIRQR